MTRTWSISEFNQYLENKESKKYITREVVTFIAILISLILVGSLETLTIAERVVEAVEWF